ncbi:DnaJ domain-containing protein [Carboxylicivirga sp. RSCT41]|uniref:DnaJ domain-containing protein n=1 Tax=Carboxylicivirga agarovorans TaxID=3417570 RepID=UPI003D325A6F
MNNYYQILDVPAGASLERIKKAYREKAKLYHPDINKAEDAHEKFILINEAYEYLLRFKDLKHGQGSSASAKVDLETFWRKWKEEEQRKARERARAHAQMKYEAYIQSDIYKTSEVVSVILDALTTGVICLLVVVMPWLLYKQYGIIALFIGGAALLPTAPLWFRFLVRLANKDSIMPLLRYKNVPLKIKVIHFIILTGINVFIYLEVVLNTLVSLRLVHMTYAIAVIGGVIISLLIKSRFRKFMVRFAYAPALVSFIFLFNYLFTSSSVTESYWYESNAHGHEMYVVIDLEGGAYDAYKGLRLNLNYNVVQENSKVTYTFGEGLLGMRVAKDIRFSVH